jgi:hypothetical protein
MNVIIDENVDDVKPFTTEMIHITKLIKENIFFLNSTRRSGSRIVA